MKRWFKALLIIVGITLSVSLCGCGNDNMNLFNDTLDYVKECGLLGEKFELLHEILDSPYDNKATDYLYLCEGVPYDVRIETVDKNVVHCVVYKNVSYTSETEGKVTSYDVNTAGAEIIWDKRVSYGELVIEDWEEE